MFAFRLLRHFVDDGYSSLFDGVMVLDVLWGFCARALASSNELFKQHHKLNKHEALYVHVILSLCATLRQQALVIVYI